MLEQGGLFATFSGKLFDPLVVKDSFLRGLGQFSLSKGGKKTPLCWKRWGSAGADPEAHEDAERRYFFPPQQLKAQIGSGAVRVRGGPARFHDSSRVPPGFYQGSTGVPRGCARAAGWREHEKEHRMLFGDIT